MFGGYMKVQILKLVTVFIIIALFSGCATTGTTSGAKNTDQKSEDQAKNEDQTKKNNKDSTKTKVQGTVFGAIAGGLIGGAIGYATGGTEGALEGLAIGALAGGGVGYLAGNKVAKIKEKYANKEDAINDEIKQTAEYNAQLNNINTETQDKLSTLNDEIAAIKSSNESRFSQTVKMKKKKDEIDSMVSKNNKTINNMNKEMVALKEYKQSVANMPDAGKLEQEISTLQVNITTLDKSNKQMAKLASSLSVRK
jgi:outer membrane lipoprotein SlyB